MNTTTISKFDYTYTPDGKIDTWTKQQGTTEFMNFVYDLAGQLKKATTRQTNVSGAVLQTLGFGYDHAGNRTSRSEDEEPFTANFNDRNQLTSGDFLGKVPFIGEMNEFAKVLVTANGETKRARVREYGSAWLFESEVKLESDGTTQVDVDATDASSNLTSKSYRIDSSSGEWASLSYDDNGNTTSRTVDGVTTTYTWDRESRLETVTVGGVTDRFVYNALGERVKIIEDDGGSSPIERRFIWAGGNQPSQERDSSNVVQGSFFGEGEQRRSGGSLVGYYYGRDHLGSVRELVSVSSGQTESAYDYSPFGVRSRIAGDPEPKSGTTTHRSEDISGLHQHYFLGATATLAISSGDTLECWVYLDPLNPPREVMLQFRTGSSWEQRAYWGENLIGAGTNGTQSRKYMGPLPETGGWVLLEVPAASMNLAGKTLNGMAFTLYDGRVWWDAAGKRSSGGAGVTWVDDAIPAGAAAYTSYGDTWTWVDAGVETEFGFTGHFHHELSGHALTYFRAYDPELGRWLSPDPLGEAGGINLYGYVQNDPLNMYDPDGRFPHFIAGAIIGGLINGTISAANGGSFGKGFVAGAVGGFVAAATLNPMMGAVAASGLGTGGAIVAGIGAGATAGALGGAAQGLADEILDCEKGVNLGRIKDSAIVGGITGGALGPIGASSQSLLSQTDDVAQAAIRLNAKVISGTTSVGTTSITSGLGAVDGGSSRGCR